MTYFHLRMVLMNFLWEYKRAILHFEARYGMVCLINDGDYARIMFDEHTHLTWYGKNLDPSEVYRAKKRILKDMNINFTEDFGLFKKEIEASRRAFMR